MAAPDTNMNVRVVPPLFASAAASPAFAVDVASMLPPVFVLAPLIGVAPTTIELYTFAVPLLDDMSMPLPTDATIVLLLIARLVDTPARMAISDAATVSVDATLELLIVTRLPEPNAIMPSRPWIELLFAVKLPLMSVTPLPVPPPRTSTPRNVTVAPLTWIASALPEPCSTIGRNSASTIVW